MPSCARRPAFGARAPGEDGKPRVPLKMSHYVATQHAPFRKSSSSSSTGWSSRASKPIHTRYACNHDLCRSENFPPTDPIMDSRSAFFSCSMFLSNHSLP